MADSIDDLLNWPILAGMGLDVLRTVSKAYVYSNGKNAIIVDTDDLVYLVNAANTGCHITKTAVDILSGQKISTVVSSFGNGTHRLALSEAGVLYGWGESKNGQLVDVRNTRIQASEAVRVDQLADHTFVKVACGLTHSVALSDEGEVWTWGGNNYSQCVSPATTVSKLPGIALPDTPCSDVVAGDFSSAALTKKGVVWMWGSNTVNIGQRSVFGGELQRYGEPPHKILFPSRVVQIAMGSAHMLALTCRGQIFAWGRNDGGQVGSGALKVGAFISQPEFIQCRFNETKVKFVDIAALGHTSAALTSDQVVYVWGQCRNGTSPSNEKYHQSVPLRTALNNLSEAIMRHCEWGSYRTLVVSDDPVSRDIAAAFDNEKLSDCRFSVEGKLIYAQKAVLQNRSQYYQAMFSVDWKESSSRTIEISHHSYPAYKALIKYLYTEKLDISDDHLLPLARLCHETIHEKLGNMCTERLKRQLSVQNLVNVLDVAMELQLQPLLSYCREFAKSNMKKIVKIESNENAERLKRLCVFVFDESNSDSDSSN